MCRRSLSKTFIKIDYFMKPTSPLRFFSLTYAWWYIKAIKSLQQKKEKN